MDLELQNFALNILTIFHSYDQTFSLYRNKNPLFHSLFITFSRFHLNEALQTVHTQPAITCSKLTIETVEQGVKYVQC